MSTPSPAFPSMSRSCSRRSRIRCACRAAALFWGAATAAGRALAGQQPDPALVGEVARLLAAADARSFDASLLGTALRDADAGVRRQAALAAGRIRDPAAVDFLVAALSDSSPDVAVAAAFALGLLKDPRAVAPLLALVRSVPEAMQSTPQIEAATALGRIGGADAAAAVRDILGNGTTPGVVTAPARRAALVEAWRLGERAPTSALAGYADDPDPAVRWRALYALGRLRARQGASVLVTALQDPDPQVRAAAARGLSRALLDTAAAVRVNALRSLASFHDSELAQAVIPLAGDRVVNVAVQAETTLGVLGGSVVSAWTATFKIGRAHV